MKPKLLIITPIIPYPLDEGGKVSQFYFLEYLQYYLDIHMIFLINSYLENSYADKLSEMLSDVTIHKIKNYQTSEDQARIHPISKTLFLKRIYWKFMDLFLKKNDHDSIFIANEKKTDDFDRPIEFLNTFSRDIINSISKLIEIINPDILQIEHNPFLNLIEFIQHKKTIFVEHEIQFGRLLSISKTKFTAFEKYKIEINRTIESALLNKYKMILCFSKDDRKLLIENNVTTITKISPFPIPNETFQIPTLEQKIIKKIIFVGGSSHYPNYDAIVWYIDNIAQDVYKKTGLKFHIIGKCQINLIEKYANYEYVVFEGYVDNLFEACTNSIMVVPLRMGSGIRTKILYGMAQQLPIISTEIGCEGLGSKNNEDIIIANTPLEFKTQILFLKENQEIANKIGESSYKFAIENFSQKKLCERRLDLYKMLLNS